jgi:hypothetical protein
MKDILETGLGLLRQLFNCREAIIMKNEWIVN